MKDIDRNKQPIVVDEENGRQIAVGRRVHFYDNELQTGVVAEVTEPESDVDDEGSQRMISPRVYVHWDGEREAVLYGGYGTSYDRKSYTFICEELVVI